MKEVQCNMKIAVIGATGKTGHLVVEQALKQGYDVTAIVRSPEKLQEDIPVIKRDILDLTKEDIEPFDVVVSCFGVRVGQEQQHIPVNKHFVDIFAGTDTRLIEVGTGANLYTDDSRNKKVLDFLPAMKKQSELLEEAYQVLQDSKDVNWTYLAPPFHYNFDGPATGRYRTGTDYVIVDKKGISEISYADLALALVDEIKNKQFEKQMFTATYE